MRIAVAACRLLFMMTVCACSMEVGAQERKPVPLFDGKTFRGWEGDVKSTWRTEDGALVAGSLERPAPRNEFLSTTREFSDFDLTLEFQIDGNKEINAGVQFRSKRIPDHHEVIGYQADIGEGVWGCLYDESRRRRMLAEPKRETVAAALKAVGKDGWHKYRIRAAGPHIQLWLNGVQTVDYTEPNPDIPQTGMIAVQIHGRMQGIVRYRNIRVAELPRE